MQGELLMINQVICKVARDPDTMNRFDYSDKGWEAADRSVREVTRNHTQPHAPCIQLSSSDNTEGFCANLNTGRSFANFNEQTVPFLGLMWLFGAFISAEDAAFHGAVYLASRFFFLPFWASGGKWNVLIELSTQPCYAVLNLWKVGNARPGFFSFTATLSVLPRPRAAARSGTNARKFKPEKLRFA
jgi:hypothetical protein